QELDLGRVELHALDFGGELLAPLLVLLFLGLRGFLAARQHVGERGVGRLVLLEQVGDAREPFQRVRLQRRFHLGEAEGVVLLVVLFAAALAGLAVFTLGFVLFLLGFFVFLVGRTGSLLADFAGIVVFAFLHLVDGRFLREHRVEIENLAQLHFAGVESFGPLDDGVEGDRAFTQAHDHRVATGLDALGDRDLAFAAEQLDRTHFAQVHPHRVVGAFGRRGLLLLGDVARRADPIPVVGLSELFGLALSLFLGRVLVAFDNVDAHFRDRR